MERQIVGHRGSEPRWGLLVSLAVVMIAFVGAIIYGASILRGFLAQMQGTVVGEVEGQVLTRERFEEEVRLSEVKFELQNRPDKKVNRPELLNRMIGDILLIHSATEAGIRVEEGAVQNEIDAILRRFGISRDEMARLLSAHALRWGVFEHSVWEYLMLTRFVDEVLLLDVPLADRESHLEAWMAERYRQADMDFDQAFLDEVNGRHSPPGQET